MILALAGGVGGARMCAGLAQVLGPQELTIVVNTGDDFEHLGLAISPDLDSVMYTLAGRHDPQQGWGLAGETWRCMEAVEALGGEVWFRLGDADLATHLLRTQRLRAGATLSEVTAQLCAALGVRHRVLPMSDHRVSTRVLTSDGELAFQDYFVRRRCAPRFLDLRWDVQAGVSPSPGFERSLRDPATGAIVICPSNPFLSIRPILALPGVEAALRRRRVPAVVVSPVAGGSSVKGPLGKMMAELGLQASSIEIARIYAGLIDGIVIDPADAAQAGDIAGSGIAVHTVPTLIPEAASQHTLAREVLAFAATLDRPNGPDGAVRRG